jgi:hypothetical protein
MSNWNMPPGISTNNIPGQESVSDTIELIIRLRAFAECEGGDLADISEAADLLESLSARVAELSGALLDIDGRLRECMGNPHISAADAYDSSYQELVSEALGAAAIRQRAGRGSRGATSM